MTSIKRFEDLECWKEARGLVRNVYGLTNHKKFAADFELIRTRCDAALFQ
jgi:hypothetical protein